LILGCLAAAGVVFAAEKPFLRIDGAYLAYSYDFNQIYGENVRFRFAGYDVSGNRLRIDLASQSFRLSGAVRMIEPDRVLEGDELFFVPHDESGVLVAYGEIISRMPIGEADIQALLNLRPNTEDISPSRIAGSLFYFSGRRMDITPSYDLYGRDVTLFIEGLESIGLTRFRLSEGIRQVENGFVLERLRYNRGRGLNARAGYIYRSGDKFRSLSSLDYEERALFRGIGGLPRQADIRTDNTLFLGRNLDLDLSAQYNTSGLFSSSLSMSRSGGGDNRFRAGIAHNRPINRPAETWLETSVLAVRPKGGRLEFFGGYEARNQVAARLDYGLPLRENLNFRLGSTYAALRGGRTGALSRIFTGNLDLVWSARIFDLSSHYFLNSDLVGRSLLSQPQLRIGLRPVSLYDGWLSLRLDNIFIYNRMRLGEDWSTAYSNNTMLYLSARPAAIGNGFSFGWDLALEEFLEKQGRNFFSGGLILRAEQKLGPRVALEGLYRYRTRRLSQGWLIEGTSGQDLSAVFRVRPADPFGGWMSLSYDPAAGRLRQSFADVSVGLVKNWRFHSQMNWDFLLNKLNNIDLYLIREAGRFQVRFMWRSISRQILVELVPR